MRGVRVGCLGGGRGRHKGHTPLDSYNSSKGRKTTRLLEACLNFFFGGGRATSALHHQEDGRASSPRRLSMGTEQCAVVSLVRGPLGVHFSYGLYSYGLYSYGPI